MYYIQVCKKCYIYPFYYVSAQNDSRSLSSFINLNSQTGARALAHTYTLSSIVASQKQSTIKMHERVIFV